MDVGVLQLSNRQRGLIGAIICICANTLISFALNVQKLAHLRTQNSKGVHEEAEDSHQGRRQNDAIREEEDHEGEGNGLNTKFLRSGLWWLGMTMMVLGEGGNFISYGFAPASLVAPLGSVALLANVFIAPLMLKERFAKSDLLGVLLASLGAAGVVVASSQDGEGNNEPSGPDALWRAIQERDFVIYAIVLFIVGCGLAYLSATRFGDRYVLIDVGTCAVFGGFTVLSTKGISSMLSFGTSKDDLLSALKSPLSYGLLFTLTSTALIQLTFLNRALQRFDARTVIPSQFVFFTISAISGSAVLFRDFERATTASFIGFVAGCMTTFAGVFVLTRRGDGSQHDSEDGQQHQQQREGGVGQEAERGRGRGKPASKSVPSLSIDELESVRSANSERTPLLNGGLQRQHVGQRPAGPIATLTTGSVPISSMDGTHLASTSLPNASLRTPAGRPIMRTPRLSLVGGSAIGAGGYLLLATPGSFKPKNHHLNNTQASTSREGDLDPRYRGLSVSPSPRPRTARAIGPQRDLTLGSGAGESTGDDDRNLNIAELSSSVTRALASPPSASNLRDNSQAPRRPRTRSSQSDLSLARSLSGGGRANRYSRELE
ncbi:unnamed protein product [Sympodiomycopsis kandeliae]